MVKLHQQKLLSCLASEKRITLLPPTGCEFAGMLARLGAEVHLVMKDDLILFKFDEEVCGLWLFLILQCSPTHIHLCVLR